MEVFWNNVFIRLHSNFLWYKNSFTYIPAHNYFVLNHFISLTLSNQISEHTCKSAKMVFNIFIPWWLTHGWHITMMMPWHENTFQITCPLWQESTSHTKSKLCTTLMTDMLSAWTCCPTNSHFTSGLSFLDTHVTSLWCKIKIIPCNSIPCQSTTCQSTSHGLPHILCLDTI